MIEEALGQQFDWEAASAIRASERELPIRDNFLLGSQVSLVVAGVADTAAGGLVVAEMAGVTTVGSTPVWGGGGAAAPAVSTLSAGARDVLLRDVTRAGALRHLNQLRAMRDAVGAGTQAHLRLTRAVEQLELFIQEAWPFLK